MNQIERFPAVLREFIEAELAAGNQIVAVASGFPAPPAGAFAKLQRPVTTRPREAGGGILFRDHNSMTYSGEFTDAERRYFVLEPPHPPSVEKNMNSIRAELEARERASNANMDDWR